MESRKRERERARKRTRAHLHASVLAYLGVFTRGRRGNAAFHEPIS